MRLDERLKPHLTNQLAPVAARLVTGIVGDEPSKFARTPVLWNAVYRELQWDAVSLPWDVPSDRLERFVAAIRESPEVAGFSVAVPHKVAIVPLLDNLDDMARGIGAVNTVVRNSDGRLIGFNTDGQGAVDALTRRLPGQDRPFLPSLAGRRVLLLGAGGAGRGVAFYLGAALGTGGALRIVNRDERKAVELGRAVCAAYGLGEGGGEARLREWIAEADLVVNATVKGQAGWRRIEGGWCTLEPYSALGPAAPARLPSVEAMDSAAARQWFLASRADLQANLEAGLEAIAQLRPDAACFDLVYVPAETRFLQDARLAGHPTLNGKPMNLAQAADAFARKVLPPVLEAHGLSGEAGYDRVFDIMARV